MEYQKKVLSDNIKTVRFRDKHYGYKYSTMNVITDRNHGNYYQGVESDPWLRAFFSNICDRPSCHSCHFRKQYRVSDFTIWDCFNVGRFSKELDNDKGATRVLVHTKKGREIFNESIGENISFSMKQQVETVASIKSMQNFVDEPANTAKSLLRRSDFPKDLETLLTTAALIFNYYGRRSICLMYAQDYREDVDIMEFSEFIGTAQLAALDTFLKGWLNAAQIDVLGQFYFGMIGTKIKEYGLV